MQGSKEAGVSKLNLWGLFLYHPFGDRNMCLKKVHKLWNSELLYKLFVSNYSHGNKYHLKVHYH